MSPKRNNPIIRLMLMLAACSKTEKGGSGRLHRSIGLNPQNLGQRSTGSLKYSTLPRGLIERKFRQSLHGAGGSKTHLNSELAIRSPKDTILKQLASACLCASRTPKHRPIDQGSPKSPPKLKRSITRLARRRMRAAKSGMPRSLAHSLSIALRVGVSPAPHR